MDGVKRDHGVVNSIILLLMSALFVGCKVTIKPEAWKRFLEDGKSDLDKPNPGPRVVTIMPAHNEAVMLDFPYWWWRETDLEPAS